MCGVSKSQATRRICIQGSAELSGIVPKPGSKEHGKSGHLRQRAPWRYLTYTFSGHQVSRIRCTVKVPALSSEGCRFDSRSWQRVKITGGICGPWRIVCDWWYKTGIFTGWAFMSVSLVGTSQTDYPRCQKDQSNQRVWNWKSAELSGTGSSLPISWGVDNLVTWVISYAKEASWRYFIFILTYEVGSKINVSRLL